MMHETERNIFSDALCTVIDIESVKYIIPDVW